MKDSDEVTRQQNVNSGRERSWSLDYTIPWALCSVDENITIPLVSKSSQIFAIVAQMVCERGNSVIYPVW